MTTSRARTIAALAAASIGAAIVACGTGPARPTASSTIPAGSHAAAVSSPLNVGSAQSLVESIAQHVASGAAATGPADTAVRYRAIQYSAVIANAGTPEAFTAFVTVTRTITVQPSSSASIQTADDGPLRFTSPADRDRWLAAGHPSLTPDSGAVRTVNLPPGTYSFLAQGSVLTYRQAVSLPATPKGMAAQIAEHLRPYAGTDPPAALVLKQLAYLIATAPLSTAARSAAWRVVATLPGLRLRRAGTDLAGRQGLGLCVDADGVETEILVNINDDSILAIEERLLRQSTLYPFVPTGSLTSSNTFRTP